MADLITRCPQCATAFRMSQAHLKSAKGKVRCGSCLHIFQASEHLEERAAEPVPKPTQTNPPPAPQEEPKPSLGETAPEDEDEVSEDESWALELLKDDSDLNIKLRKVVVNEDEQSAREVLTPAPPPGHRRDTALSQLDELLTLPSSDEPAEEEPDLPPVAAKILKSVPSTPVPPAPLTPPPVKKAPPRQTMPRRPAEPPPPPRPPETLSLEEMIAAIEPDALEVEWNQGAPAWRRRILWPLLGLIGLGLLIALIGWLMYPRLNKTEPYRSLYGEACEVIGCQLPELVDRSKIRTSNLLVRSHPQQPGSLLVDVILHNNARFQQTFPDLQLTFRNRREEPVAVHRFTPDEYLGGELAGIEKMPIDNPIHIALEIDDPGSEAVGYSIAIVD